MPPPVVGIDLGTTYARVAVVQHGKVKVIANKHGNRSTPSCVAFTDRVRLIGEDAVSQATQNPENTIFSAKRMLGFSYVDRTKKPKQPPEWWPCKTYYVGTTLNMLVKYRGETKPVPPVQVSAMVLTRMKKIAEAYLDQAVTDAVISVPASFGNAQRLVTKDAAKIAGLKVRRIINEPTAAALAYGLGRKLDREQTVLVFDLGGGTLDVSILTVADGVYQVLSTAGSTRLGGDNFDYRLLQYFASEFKLKHDMDLGDSPQALIRLRIACEEAKRTLSSRLVAYIKIDSLYEGVSFSSEISRDCFNELCDDLVQDTLGYVLRALEDAKRERSSIDEVILVGGSTRIPKIRHLLQNLFDGKRLNLDVDTDEAVACGAAAHAALLSGDASLGADGHVLVDVVPNSWGFSTDAGFFKELIERNSRVPIQGHVIANIIEDYQTEADIAIYEGQHRFVDNNSFYFVTRLTYFEPAPKNAETRMVIVFDVDLDGILRVGVNKTTSMTSSSFHCFHWKDQKGLWIIQTDSARLEAETEEASVDEGTGCREEGRSEDDDPSNREGEQKGVVLLDGSDAGDKDGDTEEEGQSSKEVCAIRPSNPCGKPQSVDQLNQQQHDEEPPVEEVADDVLFVVQALLDAEPRTSLTERLEIYYRCAAILAQVDTTSRDLRVTHHCSELHQLLRQNYGDAAGSYADDIEVPGLAMPSLYDRLVDYIGDVVQASMDAGDAGTISHDDTWKVNNMAADLLDWTFDNNQAGAYELLRRIKKLQSTCKAIDRLQIPSDDFKKGTDSEDEGDGTESTESTSSEDDDDDETESKNSDDDGDDEARQSSNDLPPLEEVFK